MGRGVVVSSMQKTVKTGMSPGDEKSYLAEYGELWSLWGGLIHVLAWSRLALDSLGICVGLLRTGEDGNSVFVELLLIRYLETCIRGSCKLSEVLVVVPPTYIHTQDAFMKKTRARCSDRVPSRAVAGN